MDVDGAGAGTLEVSLPVVAESEGLDLVPSGDGLLHWLLSPFGSGPPTYGAGHSELVSFVPRAAARLHVWAARTGGGDVVARVTLALDGVRRPVEGATVSVGGCERDDAAERRRRPPRLAGRARRSPGRDGGQGGAEAGPPGAAAALRTARSG